MLNIFKAFTSTKWGKQTEKIVSTFKAITCPIFKTPFRALLYQTPTIQNIALRIAAGRTQNTNTQHLHDKTKVFLLETHLKLHTTQLKQLNQTQTHLLIY